MLLLILTATIEVLGYIVPSCLGYLTFPANSVLATFLWMLALTCGFGMILLQNWARRVLIALLLWKLLVALYSLRTLYEPPWTLSGMLWATAFLILYLLPLFLLVHSSKVTGEKNVIYHKRLWVIAGVIAASVGVALYWAITIIPQKPVDDLPANANGELNFIKTAKTWKLNRLLLTGPQTEDAVCDHIDMGTITVAETNNIVTINGIPNFKRITFKVDLQRNVLMLNDTVFAGTASKTDRFLWRNIQTEGVTFENDSGAIIGRVNIYRGPKGRMFILFDALLIYGRELTFYYEATPIRTEL